jgi:hypothetical protein
MEWKGGPLPRAGYFPKMRLGEYRMNRKLICEAAARRLQGAGPPARLSTQSIRLTPIADLPTRVGALERVQYLGGRPQM